MKLRSSSLFIILFLIITSSCHRIDDMDSRLGNVEKELRGLSQLSLDIVPDYADGSIACILPEAASLNFLVAVSPERYADALADASVYKYTVIFSNVATRSADARDTFSVQAVVNRIPGSEGPACLAVSVGLNKTLLAKLQHYSYAVSFVVSDMENVNSVSTGFVPVSSRMEGPGKDIILNELPGIWVLSETDGIQVMTNDINVREYALDGSTSVTFSSFDAELGNWSWYCGSRGGYSISENKVMERFPGKEEFYDIIDIDDQAQRRYIYRTVSNGEDTATDRIETYRKVPAGLDFKNRIIGLWKGVSMTGDETFGNSNHLWEYHEDGTFTYYERNRAGQWVPGKNVLNEYFVHGDLLTTRWQNADEPMNYEWWTIETIDEDRMVWSALREKEDGTVFKTTFEFQSVNEEAEEKIRNNIVGVWKLTTLDGQTLPTNERTIFTYDERGTKYISMSKNLPDATHRQWSMQTMVTYSLFGNQLTEFSGTEYTHNTVIDIDDYYFNYIVNLKVKNGQGTAINRHELCERVDSTIDYSNLILGLWEGVSMSGDETYGNEEHRWEFYLGGKYHYYTKDADGEWFVDNSMNEYYVRGDWLNFRWRQTDNPECFFESWDITSLDENAMVWSALREREDGSTFVNTFELKRIN